MKKILIAACALALTGCAADPEVLQKLNPDSRYYSVDCTGLHTIQTFSHAGDYEVKINMVRVNRVGHVYVKPTYKPGDGVKFLGSGWVRSYHFKSFTCNNNIAPLAQ